jgi:FkbM family methyltransferase
VDVIEGFIRGHVGRDDVVIDVGANVGLYTRLMATLAKHVYAFEPNPDIFPRLQASAGAANVTLLPVAVSEKVGEATFYLDKRPGLSGAASSLVRLADLAEQGVTEPVRVSTTTIDRLCADGPLRPRLIKVDAQGHEPVLFRGAEETIRRCRPYLVFRFWESYWDAGFSELFARLEKDYTLIRLQDCADASRFYRRSRRDGTADIAAVPKAGW